MYNDMSRAPGRACDDAMVFSIIIPALNEEAVIGQTIERCLAARRAIVENTPVSQVKITVVSDGSTDRTPEIARAFAPDVTLIAYRKNRGYGAAIKIGFARTGGDLLGFLDADGTCDPLNFAPMINKLLDENADISMGNRLGPGSKMPPVRKVGNKIYAAIMSSMGAGRVTDTASGMRVLRAASLERIYPLPDGLDFTPAMSCRAILDNSLKIVEIPMSYEERVGKSKLSVVKDGFRFLATVLDAALTYRAFRLLGACAAALIVLALGYGAPLLVKYARERVVEEGMIYRIAFIVAVGVGGITLFNVGLLSSRLIRLVHTPRPSAFKALDSVFSALNWKFMSVLSFACVLSSLAINRNAIADYVTTGKVNVHWSAVVTGAFLVLLGFQFFAFAVMDRLIMLLHAKSARRETAELDDEF